MKIHMVIFLVSREMSLHVQRDVLRIDSKTVNTVKMTLRGYILFKFPRELLRSANHTHKHTRAQFFCSQRDNFSFLSSFVNNWPIEDRQQFYRWP